MSYENLTPANGGEHGAPGNEPACAQIIPLPSTVARADLPVIAPKAVSEFDYAHARMHIALLLGVPLDAAEMCSTIFGGLDDDKKRESPKLTSYTLTSLTEVQQNSPFLMRKKDGGTFWKEGLLDLQSKGAALYVTVNDMKGVRRLREDVTRLSSNFLEYDNHDNKSLEEILKEFPIAPSFITRTSQHAENGTTFSKYHFYWLPAECWPNTPENEAEWYGIQHRLAFEYGGDDNALDSARWLRLAGSLHLKGDQQRVQIIDANGRPYAAEELDDTFANSIPRYTVAERRKAFPPIEMARGREADSALDASVDDPIGKRVNFERAKVALQYIHPECHNLVLEGRDKPLKPYKVWIDVGMALCSRFGNEAYPLWDAWSAAAGSAVYPGPEATWTHWESFDKPGDDRHGRPQVTLATIFFYAKQHGGPNGPVPQWDLAATGPQIAVEGARKEVGPIRVPDMRPALSRPATANAEALPAAAVAEPAPAAEAQPQAATNWRDTPNPFAASASAGASAKFPLIRYRDIKPVLTGGWLIKGLLPSRGLCAIYGPPGCGKSFLTLHAMLHVAAGKEYAGRKVRQARVVYIAAEGQGGFRKRVRTAGAALGLDATLQFDLIEVTPNLGVGDGDALALIQAINQQTQQGDAPVGAVVIDTLSRVLCGADENGEGMATFIENAGIIEQALGCVVAPVHHTGWEGTRMRGWSGLHGAADTEWAVSEKEGKHGVHALKMKDGEDGIEWQFALKVVTVGLDEDKDPVTTCVVNLQSEPTKKIETAKKPAGRQAPRSQREFEAAFNEALKAHGHDYQDASGPLVRAVFVEQVRSYFAKRWASDEIDERKRQQKVSNTFNRALGSLPPSYRTQAEADGARDLTRRP